MFTRALSAAALLVLALAPVQAQQQPASQPAPQQQAQSEAEAAFAAARAVAKRGPTAITLNDQATLKLPSDAFLFIPQPEAGRIQKVLGNPVPPDFVGAVHPAGKGQDWFVTIRFVRSGYVKDDDAKDWDTDAMLQRLKANTQAFNKQRTAAGVKPLEIKDWAEKPNYDSSNKRLVWSALAVEQGSTAPAVVNYNAYALGRLGYFVLNLTTTQKTVAQDKQAILDLLANLQYLPGNAYGDYKPKGLVSTYTLESLVSGDTTKKPAQAGSARSKLWNAAYAFPVLGLAALAGIHFMRKRKSAAS